MTAEQRAPTSAGPRTPLPVFAERDRGLQGSRRPDDRRREQEGEAGRVLVREPDEEAAPHRRPGAREARDQRERLRRADEHAVAPPHLPRDARVVVVRRLGRPPAKQLGAVEQQPVERRGSPPTAPRRTPERSLSWRRMPSSPAGIVPTTSSQPSFASVSSGAMPRSRSERPSPLRIRAQSRQKKRRSTIAVARCVAIQEGDEELVVLVNVPAHEPTAGSRCGRGSRRGRARRRPGAGRASHPGSS